MNVKQAHFHLQQVTFMDKSFHNCFYAFQIPMTLLWVVVCMIFLKSPSNVPHPFMLFFKKAVCEPALEHRSACFCFDVIVFRAQFTRRVWFRLRHFNLKIIQQYNWKNATLWDWNAWRIRIILIRALRYRYEFKQHSFATFSQQVYSSSATFQPITFSFHSLILIVN